MSSHYLSSHAKSRAALKGWTEFQVLMAARHPQVTYKGQEEGQERRIRNGIVAVVNVYTQCIITVYANVTPTPLREDQISG